MVDMPLRIKNVISRVNAIQDNLLTLSKSDVGSDALHALEIEPILKAINAAASDVEAICLRKGCAPADLPSRSLRAYQWLKLLSNEKCLHQHLNALIDLHRMAMDAYRQPLIPKPDVRVYLMYSPSLFRCHRQGKHILIQAHEGFINAPAEIKQALILATISRAAKHRKLLQTYNRDKDFQDVIRMVEQYKGIAVFSTRGEAVDLKQVFDKLNVQFFNGKLQTPHLSWGKRKAYRRLGYYHPETDTITISPIFDTQNIPECALDYVLYHEMLHKKLGLRQSNGRRYAHTRAFKLAEARFPDTKKADAAIQALIRAHLQR